MANSVPPSPPPAVPERPALAHRARRVLVRAIVALLVALVLVGALWLAVVLNYSYSNGERAGLLQKLSSRGWVCKTWEGELMMNTLPGVAPEKFAFSVRDEDVARQLQAHVGQRVALGYEQHKGVPGCFAETEYFVTRVRKIEP